MLEINEFYRQTAARIDKALQYCDDTKAVVLGEGVLERVGAFFKELFGGDAKAVVVADVTTFEIAGRAVVASPESAGIFVEDPFIFDAPQTGRSACMI